MAEDERSPGALAGIKVVDLSRVLGGPSCTQMLGDHGADVIKVEPPQGDETRDWGPPFEEGHEGEAASYFLGVNRNKRCISLDLRTDSGREVLLKLLEDADVLVDNFKAGSLEKWGIGFEDVLKEGFPTLIHCQITGFGVDGPLGAYAGYDAAVQAVTGLFSINGSADSEPTRMGVPVIDLGTGFNAVVGIMMALFERERSGKGQQVDVCLFDTGVGLQFPHAANWFLSRKLPARTGNAHPNVIPYDLFPTATQPVFLAIGNNRQFRRAVELLGKPEMADDPRFTSNGERNNNRAALNEELYALLADQDGAELWQRMLDIGVPAGPAYNIEEVLTHPHTRHRGMVVEKDGYEGLGPPIKLSRTPATVRRRPAAFAEDTRAVLGEAGYSEAEIEKLIEAGGVVTKRGG